MAPWLFQPEAEVFVSLKILHLASELSGGAGLAGLRLHRALLASGADSELLHGSGNTSISKTRKFTPTGAAWRHYGDRALDQWVWKSRSRDGGLFTRSRRLVREGIAEALRGADLVHLHWIAKWMDWPTLFEAIPKATPIVLTLHDASFFAGGCHQTDGCRRFETKCGECPALRRGSRHDMAARGFTLREKLYAGRQISVVPNSSWMADHAAKAALLKPFDLHHPIFPGIDVERSRPLDRSTCREILGVAQDHFVICAGAANLGDTNKGMHILLEALARLPEGLRRRCTLLTYGSGALPQSLHGITIQQTGFVASEELLAVVYSAADVYCTPSQMETFGMTAAEAGACGLPVIAFSTGGLPEIVQHEKTGWQVPLSDGAAGLARSIQTAYADLSRCRSFGTQARDTVIARFSICEAARSYESLYESLYPL